MLDKSHTIKGKLDIETGKIEGALVKPDINLDFQGDIYSPRNITIPKIGLLYKEYQDQSYMLQITDPKILQEYFEFLIINERSFLEVYKDPQKETFDVKMKNIDFDLFKRQDTSEDKPYNKNDILANIKWTNSSIIIGDYKVPFEQANVDLSKNISHTNLVGINNTNVNIKKDKHELIITSQDIGSEFVNKIFQKNYFQNGKFELFLSNKTENTYEGTVKIDGVTFKDLQFIDNLLLFVNTTPAIINPILAIPTFIRFGASGFKMNGYYVSEGKFRFVYHKDTQILELFSIETIGNLNNFQGNITLDLSSDTMTGNLDVIFLKDFATVLNAIPLVNIILLNKDGNIAIPIEISGTLEETDFKIKGKD
jgi:hypothetical protein